ncbi:MAG: hypothetical protein JWQ79_1986 [Mucilaginibacter sp.]|nr:hypothetical protein [Mucilaginibacter sp.]
MVCLYMPYSLMRYRSTSPNFACLIMLSLPTHLHNYKIAKSTILNPRSLNGSGKAMAQQTGNLPEQAWAWLSRMNLWRCTKEL